MSVLVQEQINSIYPGLLAITEQPLDPVRNAYVSADTKRELLKMLLEKAGAIALLSLGQAINTIEYDPVWYYALRSRTPKILFDKWNRFERYAHSTNRLRIEEKSDYSALFTRYGIEGHQPSTPENLLICGIMVALLEIIGCQNLECYMQDGEGDWLKVREKLQFTLPKNNGMLACGLDTSRWLIAWHKVIPRQIDHDNSQPELNLELPPIKPLQNRDKVKRVTRHIANDISRIWKIEDVAFETGYSIRSLQRLLTQSNLNFSKLIRLIRIQFACNMLSHEKSSLTAIAFCLGFSDSAHFSRDFKASMGVSPSQYRKSLCS
ncbi:helix-turn-helix transcriptional regulator [Kiloniella majae]|uniref:helix-turn-helix transcriptional regulator n=1 Tax=Kiloniella majae TaxID=1938558 RepID=UPI000F799C43|nr:AraC family transcriptional regulator [Kiloniella majae]